MSKSKKVKATLRNATIEDAKLMNNQIKFSMRKFFGERNLEDMFDRSCYTIISEYEDKKMASYVNVENVPNISAVPKFGWLGWIRGMYNMYDVTYSNTLFITFLYLDDPYNTNLLFQTYEELFLKEPKLKYICTVGPPVDSFYEDILAEFCKQIRSTDKSVSRLTQSLYVCERNTILPKMRLRRALAEDNDDLVEIIDEKMKEIRVQLGDYYIAEEVLRNNPKDNIIVAELSNVTIGMIWINANIDRTTLARNFETTAYGNFLQPNRRADENAIEVVQDIVRRRSTYFFDLGRRKSSPSVANYKRGSEVPRTSLNNFYYDSSESESSYEYEDAEQEEMSLRAIFQCWAKINKQLNNPDTYVQQVERIVKAPRSASATNAFAIRLYGLSKHIDPRRIFDLLAGAFSAHPDKDYCLISLAPNEASSDTLNGSLLSFFTRVVPRAGCRVGDLVFVTHRNSIMGETEVGFITDEDVVDIENMLCFATFRGQQHYLPDIMNTIEDVLRNPWSEYHVLAIRSCGCVIGFVVLKQDIGIDEFRWNYDLFDEDYKYLLWEMGELKYLQMHPAFTWQYIFIVREIFRLTYYNAMHFKLLREFGKPVFNTLISAMYPIFARKRSTFCKHPPYALYYFNMKALHADRICIEDKIVIIGFTEACKGFLRNLIFSPESRYIRLQNVYVVTPGPGYIEAEYETKSFPKGHMMFFKSKNQFDEIYLRMIEFRTFFSFLGGQLRGINSGTKRVFIDNLTMVCYDKLFIMCSTRYNAPKPIRNLPSNFIALNARLDKIMFYHKLRYLTSEYADFNYPPILVYGCEVVTHECVAAMIELGIPGSKISLVLPRTGGKIDFPEQFDDNSVVKFVLKITRESGVKVYENLKFVDWNLHSEEYAIQNCIFESDFERIMLPCSMFISFHIQSLVEIMKEPLVAANIDLHDNHILIDEYSMTNIPDIYACGRVAQYREHLFAKPRDQVYINQLEVGNVLAVNFLRNRLHGDSPTMLESDYSKPLFRQVQLIGGSLYAGLCRPGRYIPRHIRKNLRIYGHDLVTKDNNGEFCRIYLDTNGVIVEIACTTRKYKNLEFVYRVFGFHESVFDNLKLRYEGGEVENLLDYLHDGPFAIILHDQYLNVKEKIRNRHLDCLKSLLANKKGKIDKNEIFDALNAHNMHELLVKDISNFIEKYPLEHAHYATPSDFDLMRVEGDNSGTGTGTGTCD